MIRASRLGRRTILVLGLSFIVAAAGPAWRSVRVFRNLRQAREHVAQGSPQDAVPLLQDLAEMSPQRADLQYLLGVAQRRAGNVDLARPFLQRARELGWSPEDIDRQERLLVVQTGQAAWAEQLLQEAARTDTPDDAAEEIYEALAVGYLMAYQLRKAEQCLSDWIDWRPEAIPPRLLMAVLLKRVARTDDARLAYEEILAIAPEHRTAHLEYAILLLQENRIQEPFAHFKYCAEVDPQKMEARLGLAECYNRMGQAAESSEVLEFVMANAEREGEIEKAASHKRALAELDAEGVIPSEDEGSTTAPRSRDASGMQGAPPVSGELPG